MDNSNKKLNLIAMCAILMMVVAGSVYLFGSKIGPLANKDSLPDYAIAAINNGQACVSTKNGQVLWNCAGETCLDTEIQECFTSARAYNEFLADNEEVVTSSVAAGSQYVGEVAGVNDVSCTDMGSGYTGQLGCLSAQRIGVVGTPLMFDKNSLGQITNIRPFTKSASNNINDPARYYNVNTGEKLNFGIKLKNNSNSVVNDNYEFFVLKLTQAPIGTDVSDKTPLCDAQLNQLNSQQNTQQVPKYSQIRLPYTLQPNEEKMVYGEWAPTKRDCGLYQIDLGAETFTNASTKICPSARVSQDRVIAAAFIRVTGNCELPICKGVELVKPERPTEQIKTASPGEIIRAKLNLEKNPYTELNMDRDFSILVTPSQYMAYQGYVNKDFLSCLSGTGENVGKVVCTARRGFNNKVIEMNFKVADNTPENTPVSVKMQVYYSGQASGAACTSSVTVRPTAEVACSYKPMSEYVEQYRIVTNDGARDVNPSAVLKTFTIPSGTTKNVRVKYEFAAVRDKTTRPKDERNRNIADETNVRCGPQSNEEAAVAVVGENLLNRTYYADTRFEDNEYADTIYDEITNPNPAPTKIVEKTVRLGAGAYSITSRWQGDGEDFWDMDLENKLYYIDVRNPGKGMVSYDEAIKDPQKYGVACKWGGSYKIRATYCIDGEEANPNVQMQKASVVYKNNDVVAKVFSVRAYVNGVKLVQANGRDPVVVQPGATRRVEYVYQNSYPQSSVIEFVETQESTAKGSLVSVKITPVNNASSVLLNNTQETEITQNGLRIKFPQ